MDLFTGNLDALCAKTEKTVILGNPTELLVDKISRLFPYGKVLILADKETFLTYGVKVVKRLGEMENKAISIVCDGKIIPSADDACGFFNASEEARAVVALGCELFSAALYFATVKSVPCFLLAYDFPLSFGLEESTYIRNGKTYDDISVVCDRYVYVNEVLEGTKSELNLCAYLLEKACSLVDYCVYSETNGFAPNDKYVSAISRALTFAAFLYDINDEQSKKTLLKLCVEADAKAVTGANFISSATVAAELCNDDNVSTAEKLINFSEDILKIYESAAREKNAFPNVPDYRTRAKELSAKSGLNETEILNNYLFQSRRIRKSDAYGALGRFYREVGFLSTAVKIIKNKLLGEGADYKYKNEYFLKFCGDTPLSFNGMSLVRELCDT